MSKFILRNLVFFIFTYLFTGVAIAESETHRHFKKLLNEAGLQLSSGKEFNVIKPKLNLIQQYENALRSKDGELEIRYAIRPLSRVKIDYEDPHGSAPDPNHLFPLLLNSMIENLSNGGDTSKREYPSKQALKLFNADWASAAAFDVTEDFSKKYKQGLLIAIHKNDKADAYAIYLYNNYQKVKKVIESNLVMLRFK